MCVCVCVICMVRCHRTCRLRLLLRHQRGFEQMMSVCVHECVHVYVCMYTHTHIYIYTHTYIKAYI